MVLLTAELCTYDHQSPLTVQVLNFFAGFVSTDRLLTWSQHRHKQKFPANLENMLDVRAEFPASISADSLLTVSRAMKLGPGKTPCAYISFKLWWF